MADIRMIGLDSRLRARASDVLHGLIFELLLRTDGRTTDLLETLTSERMAVTVLRQEQEGESLYIRESLLRTEQTGFLVSHNIAAVSARHVPTELFEKIAHRQEGIGKAIESFGLKSFRKVVAAGLIGREKAVDPSRRPIRLRFPETQQIIPFKNYVIYFGDEPGIEMVEYFNPDLVGQRLRRVLDTPAP